MSRRRSQLLPYGEMAWLLLSTAVLITFAVKESGYWRLMWLAAAVLNACLGGYRVIRTTRDLRAGRLSS